MIMYEGYFLEEEREWTLQDFLNEWYALNDITSYTRFVAMEVEYFHHLYNVHLLFYHPDIYEDGQLNFGEFVYHIQQDFPELTTELFECEYDGQPSFAICFTSNVD